MLSLSVLFASVLVGFAVAQNNSLTVPDSVDDAAKSSWCIAERNVCPVLCGETNVKLNHCLGSEIPKYDCVCGDGNPPDKIEQFTGTVPNSICLAQFADCQQKTRGTSSCKKCDMVKPSQVAKEAASSTSSSSSSSSISKASSVTSAATTPTATPGAAVRLGGEIGGVAIGVAAAVGMLL